MAGKSRRKQASKGGRDTKGRFKRTKGKNPVAVRLGKKGHRASCRGKR